MNDQNPKNGEFGKVKRLSKKKIIYIEIDDEITSVYDKIHKLPNKKIFLMVPRRAALFHSIVNLKILKKKLEEIDKDLSIITNDPVGLKLATQAGLKAYDTLDTSLLNPTTAPRQNSSAPIEAASNENDAANPTRRKSKKQSIVEIVENARDKAKNRLSFVKPFTRIKKKMNEPRDTKLVLVTPNKRAFSTLVIASLGLLILISYFALPGATVTLTTSPTVLEQAANITLADSTRNAGELSNASNKLVATYPVSSSISKTIEYRATGQNFEGTNSSGKVTIYNKSPNNWPLVANTRFQTSEGLIFRLKEFVTVPASQRLEKTREDGTAYYEEVPGKLEITIHADAEDAFGQIIGKRGNIEPTKFFLPGLKESSRNTLYAESTSAFAGGSTKSNPIITQDDVEAAKQKVHEELKAEAILMLQEQVERMNREKNTSLKLMEDSYVVDFSDPSFVLPDNIVGQELDTFNISAELTVSGVAFNFNEVMNILKNELKLRRSPEKRLVHIYDQSFTYNIMDIDRKNKKIKITGSIKGIEEFDIDPDSENGRRLAKKIKEHIVGKSKKDASNYIQNLSEINKVDIDTWPAFSPNLPSVPENIKIKVIQGEPVEITPVENPNESEE